MSTDATTSIPVTITATASPISTASPVPTTSQEASLPDDLDILKRMIRELLDLVHSRDRELSGVRHRLEQLLRRLYGPKGEKFRPDQPGLFELLDEITAAESAPPPATEVEAGRPKKKGHGRRSLPEDLRRERVEYDVPIADKVCPCCQTPRVKIGEEISEQLDYQPAKMFVWQHVRFKYACPHCAKAAATPLPTSTIAIETSTPTSTIAIDTSTPTAVEAPGSTPDAIGSTVVIVAPKPAQPIDKGLPGPGLLAFVIVSKYFDHLPLNRQLPIIARHGVDFSRQTLCGWMAASADRLRPLYDAMLADVLLGRVVQTDETRLPVLEKGNDKTKSGRLWAFVGDRDHPHTMYLDTATKARAGPAEILKNYKGFLQADAANVFDGFYRPGDIIEVGCWAHARRYFHDAQTSDAARAAEALARIGVFYDVEREAQKIIDEQKLDGTQADALRLKMRQERTLPKLREFAEWLDIQAQGILPKSPIATAVNYARNHWQALLRFTEHGFLNIGCPGPHSDRIFAELAVESVTVAIRLNFVERICLVFMLIYKSDLAESRSGILNNLVNSGSQRHNSYSPISVKVRPELGAPYIDNNASERAMRPAAMGRRNWLFAGSDEGGCTAAVLYSLTQTCRRHSIDPFAYLQDVLTRLPKGDVQELADLFPHRWAAFQRTRTEDPI